MASLAASQHRRGHSTGGMSKERDEDLALFHEMKARERNNFLHPNTDDIEASLRYRIVATVSPPAPKPSDRDLLGLEPEKNDYDWLLTPPGTPLFPSLEDAPKESHPDIAAVRAATRSRPSRISRGSSSPARRPSSPSPSTGSLNRRASFGNSSPSRPSSSTGNRPVTPTGARPSTPGRSSTPTNRRSLTPSSSFNSNSNNRPSNTSQNGAAPRRKARSSSPSRKPRAPVVHPAMPVDIGEAPPNLRTSMLDRPASNSRGASVSPRLGSGSSGFKAGELGGSRRAVSPSLSRSFSSSASSSKGSVISSYNSGVEVNRPRMNSEVAGKRPISGPYGETSPVKPVSKKPVRMTGSNSFASTSSQKKPFDSSSVRQMDFRRNSSSGFRPLMSNSHISSFYSRASNSLQHRSPASMTTDSSINSSSVASVHESDHEEEVISRPMEIVATDRGFEGRRITQDDDEDIEMALSWKPGEEDEGDHQNVELLLVATPTSSEALYSTDFHDEEMEIECQPSPSFNRDYEESVRSLLALVINEAVELAEENKARRTQTQTQTRAGGAEASSGNKVIQIVEDVKHDENLEPDRSEEAPKSQEVSCEVLKPEPSSSLKEALKSEPCSSSTSKEVMKSEPKESGECFSQLLDPKYSSSSMEVYQFDQELHTTGSEVDHPVIQTNLHSRSSSRDYSSPSTSGANPDRKTTSSSSSLEHHPKAELHASRTTSRASKPAPSLIKHFGTHHLSRKRDSRESSLFSIQISSSKGESISSGRPDDTHSSIDDTPRRFHEVCNGGSYKAYDEYDTKSEESCVDYYIDSMEQKSLEVEKTVNKEVRSSSPLQISPSKDHRHRSFDTDDEGYVDYFIDEFSSQQKGDENIHSMQTDELEKRSVDHSQEAPVEDQARNDVFMEEDDDTQIEVCSMDSDQPGGIEENSRTPAAAAINEEIDAMTECWKQVGEMDCDTGVSAAPEGQRIAPENSIPTGSNLEHQSLSETRDSILLCSSIVHDIVYRAASLGMEKEDLKALATPASAEELVTFLGISKQMGSSFMDLDSGVVAGAGNRWKSEESTVRRTLTYMQNQKLMQNTTVAYMQQSPVGRVEEDVKDHIIPEHHFIDRSLERPESLRLERKAKAKCKCTIL